MSLVCVFIGHRRSKRRAAFNFERQEWDSECKSCSAPMQRIKRGQWRLKAPDETLRGAEQLA